MNIAITLVIMGRLHWYKRYSMVVAGTHNHVDGVTMAEAVVGSKEDADGVDNTTPPSKENTMHVLKQTIMLIPASS